MVCSQSFGHQIGCTQRPLFLPRNPRPLNQSCNGQWKPTFAILIGKPNALMSPIHDRMTAFVEPRDYNEYLAPAERCPFIFCASCRQTR